MTTIFDFNPTDEEITNIFGSRDVAEDLRNEGVCDDPVLLFKLMRIRGNKEMAERFLSMIEDPELRFWVEYGTSHRA